MTRTRLSFRLLPLALCAALGACQSSMPNSGTASLAPNGADYAGSQDLAMPGDPSLPDTVAVLPDANPNSDGDHSLAYEMEKRAGGASPTAFAAPTQPNPASLAVASANSVAAPVSDATAAQADQGAEPVAEATAGPMDSIKQAPKAVVQTVAALPGQALDVASDALGGVATLPQRFGRHEGTEPVPVPQGRLGPAGGVEARSPELDQLMKTYADYYGVPERLVRRVAKRESTFNPRARNGTYLGLMQIAPATARGMGYRGPATGLLDAETNLKYAVRYLRGAYIVAGGNHDRADKLYQTGYYYQAKRMGLLDETGVGADRVRRRSDL